MKSSLIQVSIGVLVGLILSPAGGTVLQVAGAQPDVAAIDKILERYAEGVNRGDVDLWISLWDEKGIQMPPDVAANVGKTQIRSVVASRFSQLNIQIAISNEETWVAGNMAFARGTFTRSLSPKAGGPTTYFDGKYLTVLKRQADGSWKIFRDIFNSNVPPK